MVAEYKNRYQTLGLNIAYYRKLRKMTQEQLAEQLHISRQAVSKWEMGDSLR